MLLKTYTYTEDPQEKELAGHNLYTMTTKQMNKLNIATDLINENHLQGKIHEAEANFWTTIRTRNTFPQNIFDELTYGNTDSIPSRSLLAKEIYNSIY